MARSIVKVRKVASCVVITIPLIILDELKWSPGDRVMLIPDEGTLAIEKEKS